MATIADHDDEAAVDPTAASNAEQYLHRHWTHRRRRRLRLHILCRYRS
jgi:hypothetical protein